tara:strand:- start:2060 stop:5122 length:3063 start_codon:yes stop_codon:yes gene_type:complete
MSEELDPKKIEEINARKAEGVGIDKSENDEFEKKLDFVKQLTEKYSGHNQLLQKNAASQRDITQQLILQLKNAGENKEEVRKTLNISREVATAIQSSIGPYSSINQIQKQISKNDTLGLKIKQQLLSLGNGTVKGEKELAEEVEKRIKYQQKGNDIAQEAIKNREEITQAQLDFNLAEQAGNTEGMAVASAKIDHHKALQTHLQNELKYHDMGAEAASKIATSELNQASALVLTNQNLEEANEKLAEQLEIQENIVYAMGLTGQVLKTVNKALGGALGNTDKILKNSEERIKLLIEERSYYDENGKLIVGNVGKLRGFGIQLHEIGKSIVSNMLDPLVLLKGVLDFSEQMTALNNELGLTEERSAQVKENFEDISSSLADGMTNAMDVQKAALGINDALGDFAFTFEAPDMQQMVGEAAKFQNLMGASNEEMTGLMQSSIHTGKGFRDTQLAIIGATKEIESQTGIQLNQGKIMKQAATVTGEIRSQLGGSVVEITKAIATAKSFGMELKDISATANSLLDFESSINAELSAELLTGKQLNLEKARLAALTGDYQTLTKEINKNVGDFNDFSNMNVLQQREMAKAFGMTSDQMSDMLFKEGNLEEMKAKARAENDTETLAMLEKQSLQDKFNKAMEQLKQVMVDIVGGPGGKLLKQVADLALGIAKIANTSVGKFAIGFAIVAGISFKILKTFRQFKDLLQAVGLMKKAELVTDNASLATQNAKNMAKMKEDLQAKGILATEQTKGGLEKTSLLTQQSKNLQKDLEIGKQGTSNVLEAEGNTLKNTGLLTKIREGVVKAATYLKDKISYGLDLAKLGIQNLLNSRLVVQGVLTMKNIAKKGIELAITAATAVASSAVAAFKSFSPIPVVGWALAAAAAAAGAILIYKMSKPKKTGDLMSKGQNVSESINPGSLDKNEGMISVGGKTRTFDTNVDEVNISPTAVSGKAPIINSLKTPTSVNTVTKQDNSDVIAAIKALGEKPGMKQQSTDTLPSPTDLFLSNTKIGKGDYQQQNEGQLFFT